MYNYSYDYDDDYPDYVRPEQVNSSFVDQQMLGWPPLSPTVSIPY